jgi:tyrosinase
VLVSGAAVPSSPFPTNDLTPLPLSVFEQTRGTLLSQDDLNNLNTTVKTTVTTLTEPQEFKVTTLADEVTTQADCANPRIRREWHSLSASARNNFISSIQCLLSRPPSGKYSNSKNRYEDLVALHQSWTPNIHGNAKFLIWHRYFLWTFEQLLRDECGFTADFPWFDETKYAGKFSQSSIFSNDYFGPIAYPNGGCVTTGKFANLALNVGPGTGNSLHCLQRKGDASVTGRITQSVVDYCNRFSSYRDMAACSEGQAHAFGHNGVGAVMLDMYASPGDPIFYLHHAFVDHSYRIWQNQDPSRITAAGMNGNDVSGQPLTLNTGVFMNGIRPDVKIGDIINTMGTTLCYRYDY